MSASAALIHLEHVTKLYRKATGDVRALDDVSLSIDSGEFVAVRGPSGSGKSTLLALVGGLDRPTTGSVTVAGNKLAELSPADLGAFRARYVGFVFQMFHLLPYLNVLDNVLVAAPGGDGALRRRAGEMLERFQLQQRLTHRPSELSAGERQRVAIARALLNQPPLLLADEPTGNLDENNAAAVLDILAEYHAQGGTVLLVTHDAAAACRATRVIALSSGRLDAAQPQSATLPSHPQA